MAKRSSTIEAPVEVVTEISLLAAIGENPAQDKNHAMVTAVLREQMGQKLQADARTAGNPFGSAEWAAFREQFNVQIAPLSYDQKVAILRSKFGISTLEQVIELKGQMNKAYRARTNAPRRLSGTPL